jgi:FMN phosphatase YigB (HAD superfamily)
MLARMKNTYSREYLDDPRTAVGEIEGIEMPPPDKEEEIPFSLRSDRERRIADMPRFAEDYSFDVLSLDIFDTVLRRRCHKPKDVFKLLEARAVKEGNLAPRPYAILREQAETQARKEIRPEITLEEIYSVLQKRSGMDPADVKSLMDLESSIEDQMLFVDPRWLALIKAYQAKGIRIIFVSDMYLETDRLRRLLSDRGIQAEEIFVSCEHQATKHDGTLQPIVVEKTGVSAERILHVGDNHHSDYIRSLQAGWQAFHWSADFLHLPWYQEVKPYRYNPDDRLSLRIMGEVNRMGDVAPECAGSLLGRLGYEVAGPLYLSFLSWVIQQAMADGIKKLFLLGRDGYYWEKAIRLIGADKQTGLEFHYLHSSRKVLNFASFESLDEKAMEFLLTPNPQLRVRDFIDRTGLDSGQFLDVITAAGLDDPDKVLTTKMGGKFLHEQERSSLRNVFILLKDELEALFKHDRWGFMHHLSSRGFNLEDSALVDIGWQGSCVKSFERLFAESANVPVKAYFFGTWKEAAAVANPDSIRSYFVHFGKPEDHGSLIRESVNWIESLNAAPFASLMSYDSVDGIPVPKFEGELKSGFSIEQQTVIWEGAEKFLKAIGSFEHTTIGPQPGIVYLYLVLIRLLREPTPTEAREWGSLLHSEGFGIVSHTPLIAELDEETYGDELMMTYWASNWRRGFLTLLPEEKRHYVLEHARPFGPRTVDELELDLEWRQKQVDKFWNEKEGYKDEIQSLKGKVTELSEALEKLQTDYLWKSGEADSLAKEKAALQEKLAALQTKIALQEKA